MNIQKELNHYQVSIYRKRIKRIEDELLLLAKRKTKYLKYIEKLGE